MDPPHGDDVLIPCQQGLCESSCAAAVKAVQDNANMLVATAVNASAPDVFMLSTKSAVIKQVTSRRTHEKGAQDVSVESLYDEVAK